MSPPFLPLLLSLLDLIPLPHFHSCALSLPSDLRALQLCVLRKGDCSCSQVFIPFLTYPPSSSELLQRDGWTLFRLPPPNQGPWGELRGVFCFFQLTAHILVLPQLGKCQFSSSPGSQGAIWSFLVFTAQGLQKQQSLACFF